MMPFTCSNRFKIVCDHLRLILNVVCLVFLCLISVKYQYASRTVCAYVYVFRKRPGCALIGACALIRMDMVFLIQNIDCGYWLEPPRRGGSKVYPQSMLGAIILKISSIFYFKQL